MNAVDILQPDLCSSVVSRAWRVAKWDRKPASSSCRLVPPVANHVVLPALHGRDSECGAVRRFTIEGDGNKRQRSTARRSGQDGKVKIPDGPAGVKINRLDREGRLPESERSAKS